MKYSFDERCRTQPAGKVDKNGEVSGTPLVTLVLDITTQAHILRSRCEAVQILSNTKVAHVKINKLCGQNVWLTCVNSTGKIKSRDSPDAPADSQQR